MAEDKPAGSGYPGYAYTGYAWKPKPKEEHERAVRAAIPDPRLRSWFLGRERPIVWPVGMIPIKGGSSDD